METIDQVRGAANIVEIAGQYTTLRQRGRKYVGLCPFHAEKTPSFTVDAEKQLYHCFGCGVGGDVFSLVMEKENLGFPEALRHLAERYNIPLPRRGLSPQALKLEEQVQKLNESALAFFRRSLVSTAEGKAASDYLKKRGLSEAVIEEFKLGYAPNAWNALGEYFKAKGVSEGLLEKAGLVLPGRKPGEFYDRFRGRVIFPIFSLTGKPVGFGGRTLFDQEPKYLNSPDTPVYTKGRILYGLNATKEAIRAAGEFILVEGYTDFLSLYQAGFKNVAASLGTALTPHQVGQALRFAPRVIVNYDGDPAGRTAAFRAMPVCFEKGMEAGVLILPGGLDPDGFLRKHGRDAYAGLLGKAVPALQYLIDVSVEGKRMDVPEVKTKVLRSILAVLEAIPDAVVRSEYLRRTAEELKVEESVLRGLSRPSASSPKAAVPAGFLPAEKRLLQILFEDPGLKGEILAEFPESDLQGLKSEPIWRIIIDSFRKKKDIPYPEMQKAIGPPLSRELSEALIEKAGPASAEEARDCLCALEISCREAELRRLQGEIAREERNGERGKVESLLSRKQALILRILALSGRKAEGGGEP
ncbi:MAG: DNA primase [Candidatus Aminicenantes bacterium]|nr:DNA primase [Candidatus Aminicenantes bacterium]